MTTHLQLINIIIIIIKIFRKFALGVWARKQDRLSIKPNILVCNILWNHCSFYDTKTSRPQQTNIVIIVNEISVLVLKNYYVFVSVQFLEPRKNYLHTEKE